MRRARRKPASALRSNPAPVAVTIATGHVGSGSVSHRRWTPRWSAITRCRPSGSIRSASSGPMPEGSSGSASGASMGATSRRTVETLRAGDQRAGASSAGRSGSHGKGQPPSPRECEHGVVRPERGDRPTARQSVIFAAVVGIAAQELLRESGEIEVGEIVVGLRRAPVSDRLHGQPPLAASPVPKTDKVRCWRDF